MLTVTRRANLCPVLHGPSEDALTLMLCHFQAPHELFTTVSPPTYVLWRSSKVQTAVPSLGPHVHSWVEQNSSQEIFGSSEGKKKSRTSKDKQLLRSPSALQQVEAGMGYHSINWELCQEFKNTSSRVRAS